MDAKKQKQLTQIENILYVIIAAAVVTDILSGVSHPVLLILSTIILVAGIVGIISIELFKLQQKQKK